MVSNNNLSALSNNIISCHECGLLADRNFEDYHCPRCHSRLHSRQPHSLAHSWALVITSALLMIPANVMPIMTFVSLGKGDPSTILGGVLELVKHDMLWIALVVLTASIIIPAGKLVGMILLLLTVQRGWTTNARQKMIMYRFVEWIGRWSMLDIFVVGILVALVQLGNLAHIIGNHGATAFGFVVITTMLAANLFDTRLIWDKHQEIEELK